MEIKNIKDIARLAGASVGSTSMVLNNKWHKKVNPEIAQKIIKTAEKYNYKLNPLGRSLQSMQYFRIAIMIEGQFKQHAPIGTFSFYDFISVVGDKLNKSGYSLDIIQFDKEKFDQILTSGKFFQYNDAFIFLDWHKDSLEKLFEKKFPVQPYMIIGDNYHQPSWNYVYRSTEESSRKAVNHLIKNGHTEIAIIRVCGSFERFQQKLSGYKNALKDAGIVFDAGMVIDIKQKTPSLSAGFHILQAMSSRGKHPTAFFCDDNLDALSVLIELQKDGIRIPQDVEIIGYGDVAIADISNVPLSYLKIPTTQSAEFAIEHILDALSQRNECLPVQKEFEETLVLQKTTR